MTLLARLWSRLRGDEDEETSVIENEPYVKFDLSEDFYIRVRCKLCGSVTEINDDAIYGECPDTCKGTEADLWVTCGSRWALTHEKEFREMFETTDDVKVPTEARKWLVGQEKPMARELMEVARWVHKKKNQQESLRNAKIAKVKDIEKAIGTKVYDNGMIKLNKQTYRVHFINEGKAILEPGNFMRENPGPYVLRISEPGTGKTLASKILGEEAEKLYNENGIELTDVLTIENTADKQRPLVRLVPCHAVQGKGCLAHRIVKQAERGAIAEQKQKQGLIMMVLMIVIGFGAALTFTGLLILFVYVMAVGFVSAWVDNLGAYIGFIALGAPMLFLPLLILVIGSSFIFNLNRADLLNTPYPIVQHDDRPKYVQNATVSDSSTMMGSIEWNAYGNTPGLTGPLHKRVVSGIVHRGNDLFIDIDELKNMTRQTAVELLSVMEDGQSQIRTRGSHGWESGTAIAAISTQDPVPADFMLICNGNMEMLSDPNSVLLMVKAFFDRFNYGDMIYYETHIKANWENDLKIVQVITDESSRFMAFPMEAGGVWRIIEYMRSRAANNKHLRIMFRYVIKVVLKAFEIALMRKDTRTRTADVERAIAEFCDSIHSQAMKEQTMLRGPFQIRQGKGVAFGMVNGLAVVGTPGDDGRSAGIANPVTALVFPIEHPTEAREENFVLTGVNTEQGSWVQDSKQHVRAAIMKMYGKDLMKHYTTFISFAQSKDVDGPSAGTTMTIAVMSALGDPRLPEPHDGECPKDANDKSLHIDAKGRTQHRAPVPMRLDVAMTGTVELIPTPGESKNVRVGAIGGVPDKVQGAADIGCKYVVIPQENWEHTLTNEKYPCTIFGADSILAYYDLLRADKHVIEDLLALRKPATDEDVHVWAQEKVKRKGGDDTET